MNMFWRGLTLDSRIFLTAVIESVITVILWILFVSMAGMSSVQIAMSSASRNMTLMELTCNFFMITLLD